MNKKVKYQLSIMMFLQFFVWGAWFVPMWPYLMKLGFTPDQAALAYTTTAIAALISPFFIGIIADRFFASQKVLAWMHILGGILIYFASTRTTFSTFFPILLLYTITYMPTLALTNSISFEQMTNPEKEFPPIRVLGTIGWIVAGLIIGFGPKLVMGIETISDTSLPMKIAGIIAIATGLFCFTLPNTPPKSTGKAISIGDILGFKALAMLKDVYFTIFIIGSFLICIPLAFYYQSANGFLTEAGMKYATGWQTLGQMSEIVFMLLLPLAFVRFGVKKMFLIGMLAWVARYILFAYGGTENVGLYSMLFLGILLHGICYDFYFVVAFIYTDKKAPADIRASAQGFLAMIIFGFGLGIGNIINGKVISAYTAGDVRNWTAIWLIPAVMAGVVMILFAILFKDKQVEESNKADEGTAEMPDAAEPV